MLVKVRVETQATENLVERRGKDSFFLKVKARPVGGLANKSVVALLAAFLGIEPRKVHIVRGSKEPNKIIEICQ